MSAHTCAPAPAPRRDAWTPEPLVVAARRVEYDDVVTVTLGPPAAGWPAAPAPGCFAMLYAFGVGEAAISFSGVGGADAPVRHTIRAVGATSRALTRLDVGAALGWRGPFGVGWPMEEAKGRDLLIVAGGLGLAPLRPVVEGARSAGARRVALLYGARSPETRLYEPSFETWRSDLGVEVLSTVDHAPAGWRGHVGFVTRLIASASFEPAQAAAFLCGPEAMMRGAARALAEAGVAEARIWLSMERNMKCAIGLCGHCQFGADFVCRDGPVLRFDRIAARLFTPEV